MESCCNQCRYQKFLTKYDYSKGGCIATDMEGFACAAPDFLIDGDVIWMVGTDGKDGCECFKERGERG